RRLRRRRRDRRRRLPRARRAARRRAPQTCRARVRRIRRGAVGAGAGGGPDRRRTRRGARAAGDPAHDRRGLGGPPTSCDALHGLPQGDGDDERGGGDAAGRDHGHRRQLARRPAARPVRGRLVGDRGVRRHAARAPRRDLAADRALARRREIDERAARGPPEPDPAQPPVAAAAVDGRRRRARARAAADRGDRDRLRAHLGALVATAGRRGRGDRGARRRALLRRAHLAAEADPAPAHARLQGERLDVRRRRADAGLARSRVTRRVDLLVVALPTTAGWRGAVPALASAIEAAGASVAVAEAAPARAVRTFPLTDLVQARGARTAALAGIAAHHPRALIYASTTAALLGPRPGAIWFDSPAAENRPGRHGAWQRPVERRRMARAPLLLPMSEGGLRALEPLPRTPATVLPVPVEPSAPAGALPSPRIAALAYAADARKKGLARILAAWAAARRPDETLLVAGQPAGPLGEGAEGAGLLAPDDYRALLRRARVFVAAPRHEDYGIAQLE